MRIPRNHRRPAVCQERPTDFEEHRSAGHLDPLGDSIIAKQGTARGSDAVVKVVLSPPTSKPRKPFRADSPTAAQVRERDTVVCLDLAVARFDEVVVSGSRPRRVYLPMHTATRLAMPVIEQMKQLESKVLPPDFLWSVCSFGGMAILLRDFQVKPWSVESSKPRWCSSQTAAL